MATKDLLFTKSHEWVKVEDDIATIGITDYAQDQLGDIVYAETAEVGSELLAGDEIGSVESVKMASDIYSPVAGKITEVNEGLEDEPELINEDPYANWFVKVEISDRAGLDELMDLAAYEKFIEGE